MQLSNSQPKCKRGYTIDALNCIFHGNIDVGFRSDGSISFKVLDVLQNQQDPLSVFIDPSSSSVLL